MTPSEIGISQEAWQLSQNGFGQPFPLRVELATFLDYIFFQKMALLVEALNILLSGIWPL